MGRVYFHNYNIDFTENQSFTRIFGEMTKKFSVIYNWEEGQDSPTAAAMEKCRKEVPLGGTGLEPRTRAKRECKKNARARSFT